MAGLTWAWSTQPSHVPPSLSPAGVTAAAALVVAGAGVLLSRTTGRITYLGMVLSASGFLSEVADKLMDGQTTEYLIGPRWELSLADVWMAAGGALLVAIPIARSTHRRCPSRSRAPGVAAPLSDD